MGEGTFATLKNGDVMFAYTEYYDEGYSDHCKAHLMYCLSHDGGETWDDERLLLEKDGSAQNYMSPSLARLPDGALGMVFLRKEYIDGQITCMPVFTRSEDEGRTWSAYVNCTDRLGYYCAINDGVCVSKDGRVLVPAAYYSTDPDKVGGVVVILCSSDSGRTWNDLCGQIKSPFDDLVGLQEPGIYEREDGTLWLWCRTAYGFQYDALSYDGGHSFTQMMPNFHFTSPDSPMRVKKVGKYTAAIFNPVAYSPVQRHGYEVSPDRTPLICALSEDDGVSFCTKGTFRSKSFSEFGKNCYYIESDRSDNYCYPCILPVSDGFLVSYYHSNGSDICLNCTKIVKIKYTEIN